MKYNPEALESRVVRQLDVHELQGLLIATLTLETNTGQPDTTSVCQQPLDI